MPPTPQTDARGREIVRSTSPDLEGVAYSVDEHGGTYDHVPPPTGAATPDKASDPGENVFRFDRFRVRVPSF
jgi:Phosphoesterase family